MIVGILKSCISRSFVCIPNNTTHHHGSISSRTLDGTETQDSSELGQIRVRGTGDRQARQNKGHDRTPRNRVLQAGDTIMLKIIAREPPVFMPK